ncbi:pectinesterase QRT1-like [Chenopodium quinoa]|uniref:pectinesterase QRT1-like n=1 Tax=Chenopodium quinoa TaxID=63459 RepID=UPI000B76D334|nr:pectinesterase QRT1-like [Chenopodium quinoa]
MAPKKHQIFPLFPLFFLSLLQHIIITRGYATSQQEYEKWLLWNVQNHHLRRLALANPQPNAAGASGAPSKTLDVRLENAETNKVRWTVNLNGTGDYKTITEAIDSVPIRNTRRLILHIMPGVYREKIHIPKTKPFITFMGDPDNPPIITGNDSASSTRGDGKPLSTFQSATVAVDADYFIASNIIFENTAAHNVGSVGEQAVALRISGSKASFYECRFYGSQDTLYDHKGLHYFRNCFIQGSVDFIFGYGRSLYENCTLNSVAKKVASVTAQKRSKTSMSSGFSFKDCKVTGSGKVYLGRAWGDYSRVVYSFSFLDKLVNPLGWNDWGKSNRDSMVYYGEYKCIGPGSNITGRVPWSRVLTDKEAQPFIGTYYIEADTWLISPST